jgi:2-polyprenyl-3-methyl-5-hydroxy-6-metoxy-1,4-benzoquinol methylase
MQIPKDIYCEVCKSSNHLDFTELYYNDEYYIVKCNNCGFSFIPKEHRKKTNYDEYRDDEVLQEVRKSNSYIKIQRHKLRLSLIKKYKKQGNLFDIGTGWGHFLYTAKICSYNVDGIEISKLMHFFATNDLELNVRNEDLYEAEIPKNQYDIVTMWDVLEHLNEPQKAVKKAHEILKPDGIFVLQIPAIDSKIAKIEKEKWIMLSAEHINYFTKNSIKLFLENNGFEVLKIKSSFEFKLFLMFKLLPYFKKSKSKNIKNTESESSEISNTDRQVFFNKITKLPHFFIASFVVIHNIIYKLLSFFNIGDEIIVVARKK